MVFGPGGAVVVTVVVLTVGSCEAELYPVDPEDVGCWVGDPSGREISPNTTTTVTAWAITKAVVFAFIPYAVMGTTLLFRAESTLGSLTSE